MTDFFILFGEIDNEWKITAMERGEGGEMKGFSDTFSV